MLKKEVAALNLALVDMRSMHNEWMAEKPVVHVKKVQNDIDLVRHDIGGLREAIAHMGEKVTQPEKVFDHPRVTIFPIKRDTPLIPPTYIEPRPASLSSFTYERD